MPGEIRDVSGARFEHVNLSGTRVQGATLIGTKVSDAWVHSLDLSGNIQSLVVNGVEVADYLDHAHIAGPVPAQLRRSRRAVLRLLRRRGVERRFMDGEIRDVSGRRFEHMNLTGTRVHGAFLIGTKVTDAWVHSLDLSGNVQSLVVNGVEVTGYVQAELERRHPELGYLDSKDVPGLQRAWAKVQEIAAATLEAAGRLPPAMLNESVDGEFSYLQTLRHLVFAADRWITGPVLGEVDHFHPLGYPYDSAPPAERAPLDLDANPSLDEVLEVRTERTGFVDALVRDATDKTLARVVTSPNGGTTTVGDCIRIVMFEEWWHHHYADRDLALLAGNADGS